MNLSLMKCSKTQQSTNYVPFNLIIEIRTFRDVKLSDAHVIALHSPRLLPKKVTQE